MVKIVETYTDEQLKAVTDYMSRISWPERSTKKGGG
jgi:hypothetical protein